MTLQITRRRRANLGRWKTEVIYAITDLGFRGVSPAQLADAARAHWGDGNQLHWVRDVTFTEDLSQIRTGNGPAIWPPFATSLSACTASLPGRCASVASLRWAGDGHQVRTPPARRTGRRQ